MDSLISVYIVNSMRNEQFEWVFRNVIELRAEAAACVKEMRPFTDVSDLCAAFHKYLDELGVEGKLEVLKSHPDLAGRLAAKGELTSESMDEQRSAGLNDLTVEQKTVMDSSNKRLNKFEVRNLESICTTMELIQTYKEKFGFPFIICARENKILSIINGLKTRYNNSKAQEIDIGINEVKKICNLRILDIVKNANKYS